MTSVETIAAPVRRSPGTQPVLLAFGFLVLILISIASIWLVDRARDDSDLVEHTLDAQNKLSLILLTLRRAESAQRGLLITGQAPYRAEYEQAIATTPEAVKSARETLSDNPAQIANLDRVAGLIDAKLSEMARAVKDYDGGDLAAAQALVRAGEGRDLMIDIRNSLLSMVENERTLLTQRRTGSETTNWYLLAVTLAGAGIILLIGAVSVSLVRRNAQQREQANLALEDMNDNLEAKIEERTSELREANNEIQRFAYIVSHDLRSPLVNIMGFTAEVESIKKDIFDQLSAMQKSDTEEAEKTLVLAKDFDESLGFIKSSIGKMDRLINSILKLSREGQRTFKPEYVSMDQLVKTISDAVAHQAAEKEIELTIEPLPPLKSDRLALEQIFSNLVDNAMKYTKPGRPGHVRIRGHADDLQVIYEVEDNGRGIAPEDHQRVFDLFRRAGEQDQKGEGIGLAHTRALVRRLGGYMALKSELGSGSTFTVTLPRRMQENERQAA